ncbi:MAG: Flp pilus assembly complex ATPase component TadA [Candidatus Omnitrophica bacterium]|nr:Flp pilus assembly complex ATPase component TadA [Candidatus Omnitrophota bacterium]
MTKTDLILHDALINKGIVDGKVLEPCIKQAEDSSQSLANILIERNILTEEKILSILSGELNLPYLDLKSLSVDMAVIKRIPLKVASYYKFLPIKVEDRTLSIAVSYPLDIKIQDEIRMQLGFEIETNLAREADILEALSKYYGLGADTLEKIISQVPAEQATLADEQEKIEDIEKLAEDASVIKLVNQIILEAYKKRATDIHIEPYRGELVLRYRIDGVLYDAKIPGEIKRFLNAIISRIKIMSNLNIVEHRLPQDGRAIVKTQDQALDLRISTLPTPHGESVVIRILPTQMLLSLERLGLRLEERNLFERLIQKPHGIILVTGPTGSGKTTTLYACLSRINTKERKIITIEDPIEYELKGITQIQVMSNIGLDFARGLRSMLRHDPDVMMVGEVRDLETAEIAIRVALTGHLVFSTLHTNDAPSGITRLLDIGLEPFLVASSVEAFIAQRLVRVICSKCREEDKTPLSQLREEVARGLNMESTEKIKFYRGRGCEDCNFTGFYGRTAIYEILLLDEAIRDLILIRASASQIKKVAISRGMRTLRQDGWRKIIAGITTPEEVMNVTPSEDIVGTGKEELVNLDELGIKISQSSDKRVYGRLDTRINLRYKIFKSAEELLKRGYTPQHLGAAKNIGAGGILFISKEAMPVSAILELAIELPNEQESVECLARILRVKEIEVNKSYDIAACFLDITSAQRAKLDKYVKSKLEE